MSVALKCLGYTCSMITVQDLPTTTTTIRAVISVAQLLLTPVANSIVKRPHNINELKSIS